MCEHRGPLIRAAHSLALRDRGYVRRIESIHTGRVDVPRRLSRRWGLQSILGVSPTLIVVTTVAVIGGLIIVSRANNGGRVSDYLTGEQFIDSMVVVTVNDLGAFVLAPVRHDSPRFDRRRTALGLRRLAGALDAVTLRSAPDTGDFGAIPAGLRDASNLLDGTTKTGTRVNTARIARDAFLMAADCVSRLQQDRYANLKRAAEEMKEAAAAVRPDRPLLDQDEEIQRFFQRAYDVLRAM